jgi:hypothetical protein
MKVSGGFRTEKVASVFTKPNTSVQNNGIVTVNFTGTYYYCRPVRIYRVGAAE